MLISYSGGREEEEKEDAHDVVLSFFCLFVVSDKTIYALYSVLTMANCISFNVCACLCTETCRGEIPCHQASPVFLNKTACSYLPHT